MFKAIRTVPALFAVIALASCGSSRSGHGGASKTSAGTSNASVGSTTSASDAKEGDTVASIGPYTITKAMLAEWMTEQLGEDYYLSVRQAAPAGLVSEPPNYPECVAALRKLGESGSGAPRPLPSTPELGQKCETLYRSVRTQTLEYLVSTYWSINYNRTRGITVSDTETQKALEGYKRANSWTEAEFRDVLAARRRTLSQELFLIQNDVMQQRVLKKLTGESHQASSMFITGAASPSYSVHCMPNYVVEHCLGYSKSATSGPPPSAPLMKELARWTAKS